MKLSLNLSQLCDYVTKQMEFYLPDGYEIQEEMFVNSVVTALQRCEKCFSHIKIPGYKNGKEVTFSHLHMDQYATFLFFLGNSMWKKYNEKHICDKILNLNRILNGFFISYKCSMPEIFMFNHPIGSVIGNANYSNGLCISQNVTINTHTDVNGNFDLTIGKGCFLASGAKIIGNSPIGDRVSIGVDALVYNTGIGNDCICINDSKDGIVIKPRRREKCVAENIFDINFG